MLAQGDFLKLLHAETKEREKIFGLFLIHRFSLIFRKRFLQLILIGNGDTKASDKGQRSNLGEIRLPEEETCEKKQPEAEECWERLKRNVKERRLEVLDEIIRDLK